MSSLTPPNQLLDDDILEEAGFRLQDGQATERMAKSIHKLAQLLVCPLCNKVFNKPTTLSSCAHSFCVSCIDAYASNAWNCPVEGCNMPLSVVGGHGGSYRKVNPQLSQTLESLKLICESLNKSPKHWWKSTETLQSIQNMLGGQSQDDDDDDDDDSSLRECSDEKKSGDGFDEDNMIDLQVGKNEDEHRYTTANNPDDNNDCLSIDSDDSIWNRS